jgi:hypothetical protein
LSKGPTWEGCYYLSDLIPYNPQHSFLGYAKHTLLWPYGPVQAFIFHLDFFLTIPLLRPILPQIGTYCQCSPSQSVLKCHFFIENLPNYPISQSLHPLILSLLICPTCQFLTWFLCKEQLLSSNILYIMHILFDSLWFIHFH